MWLHTISYYICCYLNYITETITSIIINTNSFLAIIRDWLILQYPNSSCIPT